MVVGVERMWLFLENDLK